MATMDGYKRLWDGSSAFLHIYDCSQPDFPRILSCRYYNRISMPGVWSYPCNRLFTNRQMAAGLGDESCYLFDCRDSGLFCCKPLSVGKKSKGNTRHVDSDGCGVMYCLLCSDVSVFPRSNTLCLFRR